MACRYTTTRCAATTSGSSGGFTLPMGAALGLSPSASLVGARWWLVPRECTVCAHPESFAINEDILGLSEGRKRSNRVIARQYGLHHDAVQRHKQHIPELLIKASRALEVADADALLEKVEDLYAEAIGVLEAGKGEDDHRLVLSAIDRAGKQLETLAELRGELGTAHGDVHPALPRLAGLSQPPTAAGDISQVPHGLPGPRYARGCRGRVGLAP
jgi:hypothetical protein